MKTNDNKKDTRVVYGVRCMWWDSIDKIGRLDVSGGVSLPCCPHCQSVLYETPSLESWWSAVDKHERHGHEGYRALIEWSRGRCFRTVQQAVETYTTETGRTVTL